jgi:hypothetical protein
MIKYFIRFTGVCANNGGSFMISLIGLLPGEILYEAAKFVIMLILLVVGVCIGGKLRGMSDAKKAAKTAEADKPTVTE